MKNIFCILAIAALAAGCAKKGTEDFNVREQASFDNWMALRVLPSHPDAVRTASGIYIERLGKVTGWHDMQNVVKLTAGTSWMELDYLSRDIEGNIIATRDSMVAKSEGTITPVTHYGSHFAKYDPSATFFSRAEYEALSTMAEGDSVRIWTSTLMGYGTGSQAFANGYEGGRYSTKNELATKGEGYKTKAAVIDLALRAVVNDPSGRESIAVAAAVVDSNAVAALHSKPNFALLAEDQAGQYYRVTHEGTVEVEGGGTEPAKVINEEVKTAIYIKYVCRFLDGKLIATNDAHVALSEWGAFNDFYTVSSYTIGSTTIIGSALNNLFKSGKMRYSSTAEMIVTSPFGYGTNGKAASAGSSTTAPNPVVYPHTPLIISVEIMKEGYGS